MTNNVMQRYSKSWQMAEMQLTIAVRRRVRHAGFGLLFYNFLPVPAATQGQNAQRSHW